LKGDRERSYAGMNRHITKSIKSKIMITKIIIAASRKDAIKVMNDIINKTEIMEKIDCDMKYSAASDRVSV